MTNRIYVVGAYDTDDFTETQQTLQANGWTVVNESDAGDADLRIRIAELTTADAICLLEGWWTAPDFHLITTISTALQMRVVYNGEVADARP